MRRASYSPDFPVYEVCLIFSRADAGAGKGAGRNVAMGGGMWRQVAAGGHGRRRGPGARDVFSFIIKDSNDVLDGRKMLHLYTEDELEDNQYAGAAGLPCSIKSKQSANGIGCAWYAMHDVCPDDDTKGYWESLPN